MNMPLLIKINIERETQKKNASLPNNISKPKARKIYDKTAHTFYARIYAKHFSNYFHHLSGMLVPYHQCVCVLLFKMLILFDVLFVWNMLLWLILLIFDVQFGAMSLKSHYKFNLLDDAENKWYSKIPSC